MDNMEWLKSVKENMYKYISTKEISLLKDLDNKMIINKQGYYSYYKYFGKEVHTPNIWNFLLKLEEKEIYIIIPFLTANCKPNEPYIILSQQILVSNNSNPYLIANYINDKIILAYDLYNLYGLESCNIIFKYKKIEIKVDINSNF